MSLLYFLPLQCLCSPEFCLQTRVRSTSRVSTSGKSCRPMQWVLELKTEPFLSEAAWKFGWMFAHQHFFISQAAFFVPPVEIFSWKRICVDGWDMQFVERIVPPQLPAVSFGIRNIPLLFWSLGAERDRMKEKGERFIYILVAGCLWPLILLLPCLSFCCEQTLSRSYCLPPVTV